MLQLRSQRYYGNVVQTAVDLRQIVEAPGVEFPDERFRVGPFLLLTDEGSLQVKPCSQSGVISKPVVVATATSASRPRGHEWLSTQNSSSISSSILDFDLRENLKKKTQPDI